MLASAQDETSATLSYPAVLRIGFLRGAPEGSPTENEMESLARFLEGRSALKASLAAAHMQSVGLFPCDGGEDLLRRLDAGEFDVAFVPAKTFARQQTGYIPILQSRRPGDKFSPRGGSVLRTGAIFVSPRSPLYDTKDPTGDDVRRALRGAPFAVVSSQSIAGFVAPLNLLARDYGLAPLETQQLWFESSEEAARAVIAGLADAGACEAGALERLVADSPKAPGGRPLARVIRFTEPLPSDPVVVRRELSPATSALGRELRAGIREHFIKGVLQYQEADADAWRQVPALLSEFENNVGALRP